MIQNRDFIVFSDDWGRYPFSCQHIMQKFLPNNRLLWVNTIGMRNPTLSFRDLKRSVEKLGSWLSKDASSNETLPQNLHIVNPHMLPFSNIAAVRRFNKSSVVRSVSERASALGFSNPIVVTTLPITADYIGALNEKLSIYYCVDDYAEMPGNNPGLMQQLEQKLLQKVDVVCASAASLVEKTSTEKHQPLLLAHGVDTEHFCCQNLDDDTRSTHTPTIGFFGAISPWLDLELLEQLAAKRSDWRFVLIGPADADISRLQQLPNVVFPGKTDYAELPGAAAEFDVALIPFKVNTLTLSVNPLKMMEYLALGLPVVSTPLPEVEKHSDLVFMAKDAAEFEQQIEQALANDSEALRRQRIDRAGQYSWRAVAERFSAFIEEHSTL
ncbi:MAG: glycosyltransferase [Desulfuromonadales bacterium]|nr:glycosyltransferase [Desulfuromonadales bacterium]